ncbi:DUF4003 family protein [Cytobacillus massiliigabonensis]|uniref:DUF4003 family protein n=1 Tax=Cytobacillus massiliigabonensis TaxID=1871011 RepID=UPI000C836B52|nr:DUF4003 family protein [Cytobacillus massiliigabonensis]
MEKRLLEENIEVLRRAAGNWMDRRLVLMTAAQFAAKGKKIDGHTFVKVSDLVKSSTSMFSPLRGIYFPLTGLIMAKDSHPEAEISRLHHNYKTLRMANMRSSAFTYIAAFLLHDDMDASRISAIYEEMKKHHRFLTSYDDYPAAVIIAKREGRVNELIEISERYYRGLNEKGLWKGNNLQFLANMLVMCGDFQHELVRDVIHTKEEFIRRGLKVKEIHYPALGVIALTGNIKEAASLAVKLAEMKEFKWYKEMAITVAATFVSQDYIDASAGLTAAIHAMIQAQQASAAAVTASAVAAASSGS